VLLDGWQMRMRWHHLAAVAILLSYALSLPLETIRGVGLSGWTGIVTLRDQIAALTNADQLAVLLCDGTIFSWGRIPIPVPLCLFIGSVLLLWRHVVPMILSLGFGMAATGMLANKNWELATGHQISPGPGLYLVLASAIILDVSALIQLRLLYSRKR
jgi:hypothetical protein